jgi:hypothetical protein
MIYNRHMTEFNKIALATFAQQCPLIAGLGWNIVDIHSDRLHRLVLTRNQTDSYQAHPYKRISQSQAALDSVCQGCSYHGRGDVVAKSSAIEGKCYPDHGSETDSHPIIGVNIR